MDFLLERAVVYLSHAYLGVELFGFFIVRIDVDTNTDNIDVANGILFDFVVEFSKGSLFSAFRKHIS